MIIRQQIEARFDLVEVGRREQGLGRSDRPVRLGHQESVIAVKRLRAFGDVRVAERDAEFVVLPLIEEPDEVDSRVGIEIDQVAVEGLAEVRMKTPTPRSFDFGTLYIFCSMTE